MSGMGMLSGMTPPPAPGAPESSSTSGGSATDDQKNEIKINLAVVYSNMGACHLKNQNYKRAIEVCNKALQYDPANVKAKFRRAQAKLQEGNLAGAEADLNSLGDGGSAKARAKSVLMDLMLLKDQIFDRWLTLLTFCT